MNEEIWYSSATELASRIRENELSPVEVIDAFLNRIDDRNEVINAFITVCGESAREEAKRAEEDLENGRLRGPLHGVPVAIKDLVNVEGVRTTFGSNLFGDSVAEADDIVVQRLKDAGAIIIGKTNTSEFGRKPMTTNLLVGATSNPWDLDKTVGGSSGGSAAALADGMVPLALGTDAAGSIRVPASVCGVVGLMPDFGRIPIGPRADQFVNILPYTCYGPMARTVPDAALMLNVMTGYHQRDPYSLPDRSLDYTERVAFDIGHLDIAYTTEVLDIPIEDEIHDIVTSAVRVFDEGGARVTEIRSPFEHSWEAYHDALETLLQIRYRGLHENLKRTHDIDVLTREDDVTAEVVSRVRKSLEVDALDYSLARKMRTSMYEELQGLLTEYDLLVTPTIAMSPFEKNTQPTEVAGAEIDPLHGWVYTWPLNLTGNPAISLPVGFSSDGLPVGLQVIGRRFADDVVVGAAAEYARVNSLANSYRSKDRN